MVMKDNFKFYREEPLKKEEPSVKIDVPGFKKGEISVKLTKNSLIIEASKQANKAERGKGYYKEESFVRSFMKSVSLPHEVDPKHFQIVISDGHVVLMPAKRAKKR